MAVTTKVASYKQNIQRTDFAMQRLTPQEGPMRARRRGGWRMRSQTAYKPGSVPPPCGDATVIPLDRPLRSGSRDQPGRLGRRGPLLRAWSEGGRRPYSVLLLAGLAMPSRSPGPRWALTPPFHPYLPALCELRKAVCFLWRFPWGRPRRALPAAISPWSPDFPPSPRSEESDRPAV